MATKVVMEALSPTMEEGRLVKWLKNEGDAVKTGDILAEVETDKAVMELVARADGIVRKRLAAEGDASPVGTLLAVIAGADENIDALLGSPSNGTGKEPAAADAANEAVAKTTEDAGATAVPTTPEESQGEASTPPQEKTAAAPQPTDGGRRRSSPLARRLATERGIDLGSVHGSGPGGRIIKRDIETAATDAAQRPKTAAPKAAPRFMSREGDFQDIPLTQIRKTIARRLVESIGPVPTFYLTAEFEAGRAAEMRAQLKELGDEYKVSFNDIVIKAVANALSDHPEANAHWMGDRVRHFNRVHVAMAVAVAEGLITPVIFDADQKSLSDISSEAKQLAERARQRKLTPEQYTGSTFSVSNLGMFGIDQFTAIINPPEAGILAVGAVEEKAVVIDGQIVVRQRMRVTMSCDHRVIDGATGAKFLQSVRRYFENPLLLVL
ncbi:MAG TPA: pyruvate dehydrogenase complex dihydrolipoamide acetyltransferase [Gemmatimonadaceae bacterium]|nr:pyruvate dehydrogenase complex dihydrolipoamide acetyltransferase [Gemmatimonadaceae bacterium]